MTSALERVTAASYFGDLESVELADIRTMRAECQDVETGLSYLRRLIQGRLDLVATEVANRERGEASETLVHLIERLPGILADRGRAPGNGRLPQSLGTGDVDEHLERQVESAFGGQGVSGLAALSDAELAEATDRLAEIERQVSDHRRVLFDKLDALQAEIARRYRTGEATVETLLQ